MSWEERTWLLAQVFFCDSVKFSTSHPFPLPGTEGLTPYYRTREIRAFLSGCLRHRKVGGRRKARNRMEFQKLVENGMNREVTVQEF